MVTEEQDETVETVVPTAVEPATSVEPAGSALPAIPSSARGVDAPTALNVYMSQLKNHAPITREEEHALAVRWRDEGDTEAGRLLVLSNLRLVVKIAMEYKRAWTNTLDLIQEGNVGLLEAVQRFDPYQGTKLSSYAAYWIRAYILKYLIDNIRLVKLSQGRAQRKLFFRLNKEKRELERQGYKPSTKLIAERLDVDESEVVEMETRLGQSDLSIDAPIRDEEGSASYGDFLASSNPTAEDTVADDDLRAAFLGHVARFQEGLADREQRILEARILSEEPLTLRELGEEMDLTRERIRQLEKKLIDDLREYLRENVVDFEFYAPDDD